MFIICWKNIGKIVENWVGSGVLVYFLPKRFFVVKYDFFMPLPHLPTQLEKHCVCVRVCVMCVCVCVFVCLCVTETETETDRQTVRDKDRQ